MFNKNNEKMDFYNNELEGFFKDLENFQKKLRIPIDDFYVSDYDYNGKEISDIDLFLKNNLKKDN